MIDYFLPLFFRLFRDDKTKSAIFSITEQMGMSIAITNLQVLVSSPNPAFLRTFLFSFFFVFQRQLFAIRRSENNNNSTISRMLRKFPYVEQWIQRYSGLNFFLCNVVIKTLIRTKKVDEWLDGRRGNKTSQ